MGSVGKTRAAIEYTWKHADDYHALLFISPPLAEAIHRNLAAILYLLAVTDEITRTTSPR